MTSCLLLVGVMSCQNEVFDEQVAEVSQAQNKQDYLEFKSEEAFAKALAELNQKSHVQLDIWEQEQKGFVSLRKRYNEVIKAEEINGDNGLEPLKSREATLYARVYVPSEYGGIEPNVADWRMMAVVNVDGIVKIGNFIHQFSKSETKSILHKVGVKDDVAKLKATSKANIAAGLTVFPVVSSQKNISGSVPSVKGARPSDSVTPLPGSRFCEGFSGSPQEWRIIAYEEMLEIKRGGEETICEPSIKYNSTTGQYEPTISCRTVTNPNLTQYQAQLHIRTLKRGFWGSWNDRSSSGQQANGTWKLTASSTIVSPGWNSGNTGTVNNPFANTSYNVTNTTGETSTLNFIFWTSTLASSGNSNVRLDGSSTHNTIWNGYNCQCSI